MAVYLGIDWSEKSHAIVFMNEEGGILAQNTISQTGDGFAQLDQVRRSLHVSAAACVVGIESAHLLLIDWLWAHDYGQLYVVPPSVTRSRQSTYRQSGARSDSHDAYLIANLLRTDRHLLHPWSPDSCLTQQIRSLVTLREQFLRDRVRGQNRLRALLLRYHPVILNAFSLDSDVGLAFLDSYPTPEAVAGLSWDEFQRFADEHAYAGRYRAKAFASLQADLPVALPDVIQASYPTALLLTKHLMQTRQVLKDTQKELRILYRQHPDAYIYDSLPGVGEILGPGLLSKLGDDRQRFPNPSVLQAFAGTSPVTEQSGSRRYVRFRHACDPEFRNLVQQWAQLSVHKSPWAAGYLIESLSRGHNLSRAYRGLANRWMAIMWKLWQVGEAYDEALHLQRVKARSRPRSYSKVSLRPGVFRTQGRVQIWAKDDRSCRVGQSSPVQ